MADVVTTHLVEPRVPRIAPVPADRPAENHKVDVAMLVQRAQQSHRERIVLLRLDCADHADHPPVPAASPRASPPAATGVRGAPPPWDVTAHRPRRVTALAAQH